MLWYALGVGQRFWSQTATTVVASKYFRGALDAPAEAEQREHSIRQLIGRVVETITGWGADGGYFANSDQRRIFRDELEHVLLHQLACFNSPVWFNVGVEPRPQCSACFINSVEDTMPSILELVKTEGMLFKYGSGTGSNLSTLRSCREELSGGGTASGPVSFMKVVRFGSELADLLRLAGAIRQRGGRRFGEVLKELRTLRHDSQRALRDLAEYAAIPRDAPAACRCASDSSLTLPAELDRQTVDLAIPPSNR